MLNAQDIAIVPWYPVPDDMTDTGSWCVMNVPKTPVAADPQTGEIQIARYLTEGAARQIAGQHNAALAGLPETRPGRYRVQLEDVDLFDHLGETISLAERALEDAAGTPPHHPLTEISCQRAVLREVLIALNLLTEGAIRLRSVPEEAAVLDRR